MKFYKLGNSFHAKNHPIISPKLILNKWKRFYQGRR